jgi:hypothetical protein
LSDKTERSRVACDKERRQGKEFSKPTVVQEEGESGVDHRAGAPHAQRHAEETTKTTELLRVEAVGKTPTSFSRFRARIPGHAL